MVGVVIPLRKARTRRCPGGAAKEVGPELPRGRLGVDLLEGHEAEDLCVELEPGGGGLSYREAKRPGRSWC